MTGVQTCALPISLQDWYDSIDNALTVSEIIPGNYEYSTATSYGNVGDINEGDSTFVDVFCDRFKIISLDNSYISLEQEVKLKVNSQQDLEFTEYYIGYKCSADIIDHYRFYSNTDKIQGNEELAVTFVDPYTEYESSFSLSLELIVES